MLAWLPPEPDPYWRALELLVIGGTLLVVALAAFVLAFGFLRDLLDKFGGDRLPHQSLINERLRKLPGSKPKPT